jgi:hypothetical protein
MGAQAEVKRLRRLLERERAETQFWMAQAEWWGDRATWICAQWVRPETVEEYSPFP